MMRSRPVRPNRRGLILRRRIRRRQGGQSLVMIALSLPFLIMLVLTSIEIGNFMLERAEVEDALHQAARSAVQTFEYQPFAENRQALQTEESVEHLGRTLFMANLQAVNGLVHDRTTTANLVRWAVYPTGGTCLGQTFATPMVCAELDVPMQSLVGWDAWTPHIETIATIDRID